MISRVEFGLLSPEQIKKMSIAKIVTPDTHDTDGYPIKGGLMDPRLGVIDPGLRCRTCRNKMSDCPGHFGHIDLARPVVHVGYVKYMYAFLRAICTKCSRILISDNDLSEFKEAYDSTEDKKEVVDAVIKTARTAKKCPHCGAKKLEIKYEKPTTFLEDKSRITTVDIRERFLMITDDDAELLGMNPKVTRPEWMILSILPVPPVTTRPSITLETGERSEDDLTHKLVDILRLNQRLAENIDAGAPQLIIEDQWELVQYHVTTYLDNTVAGIPPARHRSGRPLKTIAQRLKGKEGRFRHSLAGKRVNFSARTVISPDANIRIDEVGIPVEIARELTIPEKVNELNKEFLKKLILNGEAYPGVNYIIKDDGRKKRVLEDNKEDSAAELEVGWTVERHLIDGDLVLFNRQPSLHKPSIMAHHVKVLPGKTFRLNLCVCPPYNADFDGDEMNLHAIQSLEARAEATLLMQVPLQIRSPRFGGPIIGCIHDHITGIYMLTRHGTEFSKEDAMQLLASTSVDTHPIKLAETEKLTGKEIFSMLLPKGLNLSYNSRSCRHCDECEKEHCKYDSYVTIEDGRLLTGAIDDKSIGAFSGVLLQTIFSEFGPEAASNFLDSVTKLSISAAMYTGVTTGLNEEDLSTSALKEIEETIQKINHRVDELVASYQRKKLEPLPGRTIKETLEEKIMTTVNRGRDRTGRIAEKNLDEQNQIMVMARTGARGNILNITQMSACLGQQAVRGKRISRGYKHRTLPHFGPEDLGAKSHGFIGSSYKRGLDPIEFFFHAMGGRESLTDTAMRTPKSGYLQRRLINAGQDIKVENDGTVRDNTKTIIQFKFGEDGIDPSKTNFGKFDLERILEASK